ncbi:MAG: hypothetical protein O2973_13790 [Gemmatimonadetes bacterium]|nr:hypothetical protein [Gemmatimonadota bacterium]
MSEPERAENPSARARSTHVAHFIPNAWPEVAARLAPLISRVDPEIAAVQVLVLVPTASDAVELARALGGLDSATSTRIAPLATPRRARRLAADAKPHVVVGTPAVIHSLIAASALSLAEVSGVGIAAAADFESDAAMLDQVLAELPRGVAKTLVSSRSSPFVERLIEAQMHGARQLTATDLETAPTSGPAIECVPVEPHAAGATLGDILEIVDAPSAAVLPADAARERMAREVLASLGYAPESTLARVASDGATGGAALVVLLGAPSTSQWAACMAAPPARVVALVGTRERAVLAAAAVGAHLIPFTPSSARGEAAAAEEAMRDRLRRATLESFPAREMLALEPLLGEFDALVLAGAALRLFERERDARRAQEARPAAAPAPSAGPRDRPAPGRSGTGRPPRGDDRGRPPRGDDRGRPPSRGGTRPTSNPRDRR